jgi:adenylate cyclase
VSFLPEHEAWLTCDGTRHSLDHNCSIGRATLNSIVLDAPKVSRLHSIIEMENTGVFWLIDLGSSNGTFLNGRRIREPVRLHDQDQLTIGNRPLRFHQPRGKPTAELTAAAPLLTVQEVESTDCWILVADIKDFTPMSRSVTSSELADVVSRWLGICKQIIEKHHGVVNKYLGDGVLAYWQDSDSVPEEITRLIASLKEAQAGKGTPFRFVLHFGTVAFGGIPAMREETLMGSEVNLAFRLEKLAGSMNEPSSISEAAQARMGSLLPARSLGEHELKGFEGRTGLFAV